ncbi:uncharacterized protein C22orf15 homolog [Trichechus manatus latirostris]|uniref:Uncharacterized protein C22orf15 homolog n=1 Tax=Trichechus manatus latirostris TaxID=127582 RepID=A0A2Y9G075_TRIMA|nr:uncharacterized protein C22orf15 homolog [Trichechus manatus latirostris]
METSVGTVAVFITVMFGAGCWELVNPWCSLVTLTTHLRERSGVPQDVTLALLAEDRHLVSLGQGLEEGATPAPTMGSSLLQERETYILIRILSKWGPKIPTIRGEYTKTLGVWGHPQREGGAPTRCTFLLENLDNVCSELAVPMTWHPMAKWLSWTRSQEAVGLYPPLRMPP